MLENYSPYWGQYQILWEKYGKNPSAPPEALRLSIATQEDAIQCSLKLHKMFSEIAAKENSNVKSILSKFVKGVSEAGDNEDKLLFGLAKIGSPVEMIRNYELFFRFNSLDDLFLSDESNKNSVIVFD